MLLALKKLYEARIAEHTSIIDIYLQKPVGIGDHDHLLKVIDERLEKLNVMYDYFEDRMVIAPASGK